MPLGECYTKGREFRVTVGIKPETIKAAETLSSSISQSVARQSGDATTTPPQQTPAPRTGQKLDGMDSFSRTDGLKSF